jgi:hypothetical protein
VGGLGRSLKNLRISQYHTMTENELQLNGRLYALEYLLTQALVERFRCIDDTQKAEDSGRMLAEIASNVASQASPVQTHALETAQRILWKAVGDSTNFP